jgi:hypothetical protein
MVNAAPGVVIKGSAGGGIVIKGMDQPERFGEVVREIPATPAWHEYQRRQKNLASVIAGLVSDMTPADFASLARAGHADPMVLERIKFELVVTNRYDRETERHWWERHATRDKGRFETGSIKTRALIDWLHRLRWTHPDDAGPLAMRAREGLALVMDEHGMWDSPMLDEPFSKLADLAQVVLFLIHVMSAGAGEEDWSTLADIAGLLQATEDQDAKRGTVVALVKRALGELAAIRSRGDDEELASAAQDAASELRECLVEERGYLEFEKLTVADVAEVLCDALESKHDVGELSVAAALSLKVGAFGDRLEKGEGGERGGYAGRKRIANRYDRAIRRRAGRGSK